MDIRIIKDTGKHIGDRIAELIKHRNSEFIFICILNITIT